MSFNVAKDVEAAIYASMVRGIVLYHAFHLKLLVTYGAITSALKVAPNGGQINNALGLITEDDYKNKRPLTTAIVVNSQLGRPGKGFFEQLRRLGYKIQRTDEAEESFWLGELAKMGVAPFTLDEFRLQQGLAAQDPDFTIVRSFSTPTVADRIPTTEAPAKVTREQTRKITENFLAQTKTGPIDLLHVPGSYLQKGDRVVFTKMVRHPERRYSTPTEVEVVVQSVRKLTHIGGSNEVEWVGDNGETYVMPAVGNHVQIRPRQLDLHTEYPIGMIKLPDRQASALPDGSDGEPASGLPG